MVCLDLARSTSIISEGQNQQRLGNIGSDDLLLETHMIN